MELIDLHRHLEGSLRPATVAELTGRAEDDTRALIQLDRPVADLVECLRCNDRAIEALVDLDACERVAAEAVEDAAAEGVERLELRFSPLFMSRPHALEPPASARDPKRPKPLPLLAPGGGNKHLRDAHVPRVVTVATILGLVHTGPP